MRKYFLNYCCVKKKKDIIFAAFDLIVAPLYTSRSQHDYSWTCTAALLCRLIDTCSVRSWVRIHWWRAAWRTAAAHLLPPPPPPRARSIGHGACRRSFCQRVSSKVSHWSRTPSPATLKIMLSKIGQIFVTVLSLLYRAQKHCRFSLQFLHVFESSPRGGQSWIAFWSYCHSTGWWRHNDHVERQVARGTTRAFA